jgi:hypothetical protein
MIMTHFLEDIVVIRYLAGMRFQYLLISFLILYTGCGGKSINSDHARDLIAGIPQDALEKDDLEVGKVTRVGGSESIVAAKINVAFRFEKVGDQWAPREVKIGHGQWQKINNLTKTLEAIKIEETREMLDRVAEAIQQYRKSKGDLPSFKDYVALSDLLSPEYLSPLIRLDAWRQPLGAVHPDSDTTIIFSSGPDGTVGTNDDIKKTVGSR